MCLIGTFLSLTAHLLFGGIFPSLVRVPSRVLFSSPSNKPSRPVAPRAAPPARSDWSTASAACPESLRLFNKFYCALAVCQALL